METEPKPFSGRREDFADFIAEKVKQVQNNSIETDINKRWESGIPHHPKSIKLYGIISEMDLKYGNDSFCWKSGGDGDNGETLMYLMDIHFELDALLKKSDFDFYNKLGAPIIQNTEPDMPDPKTIQYADYILNHYSRDSQADKIVLARDLERHGFVA